MTGKKEKTISGAMYSAPNLEHNLRTHIPPNSVEERRHLNMVYTDDWGITLQQVYEKLFAEHYRVWREREIKKGRGKRFPPTYYEKIEQDKQKHLCYEIIWQIGDMRDTGFVYTPEDANRAQDLLDEFAKYLLELPEVCVVTEKELNDPNWKPPFEAGLIVHHMVYHGDENSPHIHMTYIPYTTNSSKGAPVQNAFAQTFRDLGYPTTMKQAVTETGELVWQKDEDGNLKPQMKRNSYGGADWVEAFLAHPFVHEPGTFFWYNSMGTYMLSAIVQKVTGEKIIDYLYPRLFRPLGIVGATWLESNAGINTGGWGLYLKTEDLAKMGQLILQKGEWNGKQIIPAEWIEEATRSHVASLPAGVRREELTVKPKDSDWLQGYGYQMWRCRHNAVRADGAAGQYIIVMPDQNAVIAMTANIGDMQSEINLVWKYLLPALKKSSAPRNGARIAYLAM